MRFRHFTHEWTLTTIGNVSLPLEYGLNSPAVNYDGKHKYIRITDINDETHRYINDNPVSPDNVNEGKYRVVENDILFARTGASTGKSYLYSSDDGELYFAGFLIKAHIKEDYDSYFVFSQTLTSKYDKWVKLVSVRSGQPGINSQEYSGYSFYIPRIEEQRYISGFLRLLDEKILTQNKIINSRKSLIISLIIEIALSVISFIESIISLNLFSMTNNLLKLLWTIFKEVKRIWSKKKE